MAFPQFILDHMSSVPAGIVLATLLITVLGTGSGLSLGISTVVSNDIIKRITRKFDDPEKSLILSRMLIVIIMAAASILCMCPIGDTILNFAFMSMGLRGAVIFAPLCGALWLHGRIGSRWIMASVIISPLVVLVFGLLDVLPFDPLFLGVGISVLLCFMGLISGKGGQEGNS